MAGARPETCRSLNIESTDQEHFIKLQIELFGYITPGLRGVDRSQIFVEGAVKYGAAYGFEIEPHTLEIPKRNRPGANEVRGFILKALTDDIPVAFLNLSNGNQNRLESWHWVTIIGFKPDCMTALISDYGGVYEVDLNAWLKTSFLGGVFVYFILQEDIVMDKQSLKKIALDAIEQNKDIIIEAGNAILRKPELGYKEWETAKLVKEQFQQLGLEYRDGIAITGVKAVARCGTPGPQVAVLGELDAVVCPAHPFADPVTGAAHCCGHNAQIAAMLGVAYGLVKSGVLNELAGSVVFMAVPAEEFVELEYRQTLAEQGKVKFLGGKQEMIANGDFDGVDLAMMVHATSDEGNHKAFVGGGSSAFLGKTVHFKGKESHAGGSPETGINALNAAMSAIMMIHAQRETFKDSDGIRVHPILTKGGDLVNIVPADVRMETFVRGKTIEGVGDANKKVNRAIKGAAYAIGAKAEIKELPGYLALNQNTAMSELFAENMRTLYGDDSVAEGEASGGSTDMGDLSGLIPSIHPAIGGFTGGGHSKDYTLADEDAAYLCPAKIMAMTVIDLLYDNAEAAKMICAEFKPLYTKEEYVRIWNGLMEQGEGIEG